jgi:hypothetical protein
MGEYRPKSKHLGIITMARFEEAYNNLSDVDGVMIKASTTNPIIENGTVQTIGADEPLYDCIIFYAQFTTSPKVSPAMDEAKGTGGFQYGTKPKQYN